MICPACRKDTLIVEYRGIELDYCQNCGGVWFDSGELELFVEAAGLAGPRDYLEHIARTSGAAHPEKKLKCPVCRHKMNKAYVDEKGQILVDVCHVGHGIWFDGGEIQSLVKTLAAKAPSQNASPDVVGFIGEMFKYQPQRKGLEQ